MTHPLRENGSDVRTMQSTPHPASQPFAAR
jgi:hypothetical protein